MTLALQQQPEAHPLGQPSDRLRYGMTPSMAIVYADLVRRFGDRPDDPFVIYMRETGARCLNSKVNAHRIFMGLVERGWIEKAGAIQFRFVPPVMRFPKVPNVWSDW